MKNSYPHKDTYSGYGYWDESLNGYIMPKTVWDSYSDEESYDIVHTVDVDDAYLKDHAVRKLKNKTSPEEDAYAEKVKAEKVKEAKIRKLKKAEEEELQLLRETANKLLTAERERAESEFEEFHKRTLERFQRLEESIKQAVKTIEDELNGIAKKADRKIDTEL